MTLRHAICALVLPLVGAFIGLSVMSTAGCRSPYSGRPEHLKRPRPKKAKKDDKDKKDEAAQEAAAEDQLDDKCRTNFYADPSRIRRRERDARNQAHRADRLLREAEGSNSIRERVPIISDAVEQLNSALDKDPYGPLATYKLAVAYAMVNKKGCALALLERLKQLQDYPPVESEAIRTVKRAAHDIAFDKFHEDARNALGE